ncbi:hypothetical protein [Streptomyces sp. NRRL S-350]|uniref:hypothetical protein n=1 Tax=Streptomyces sp. NRRL S-350 TaxID=1463902 RepID=UPI0004C09C82|nr:hypothetical protein [Streptomyces sp. NRRL S-350]
MEAQLFGYQVLPGVALDVPATAKASRVRAEEAFDRRQLYAAGGLAAVSALLVLIGQWASQAASAALICLGTLAVFLGWIWYRRSRVQVERTLLGQHPWQVWPCHVQALTADEVRSLRHTARPGTTACRVRLLAPGGAPVRSGRANLPTGLWDSMTDGIGTLWVCGDLRDPFLVSAPGGTEWTLCRPDGVYTVHTIRH